MRLRDSAMNASWAPYARIETATVNEFHLQRETSSTLTKTMHSCAEVRENGRAGIAAMGMVRLNISQIAGISNLISRFAES